MTPRARIAAGIVLILVAPLVSFWLILNPVRGFSFIVFLIPGVIVLYGIFLVIFGLADKRRGKLA